MEILIAIAHIFGSFFVLGIFGLVMLKIARWEAQWNLKKFEKEVCIALGIPEEDVNNDEYAPEVIRYSAQKFSRELIQNRVSDVCGVINRVWGWLSNTVLFLVLGIVIWQTIIDGIENAIYAWYAFGSTMGFWFVSVVFTLGCKLLTGRYPGQAKEARKFASEWVNNNIDEVLYNKN